MSKIILDTNDTISIGAGSSDTSIYGGSGSEKVIVAATAASIYVDQSVERTELSGASTAYSYLISGNNLLVKSGTTTVATIIGGNGTKTIAFSDGSAPFAVTGVGVATLGGQSISASTAGTLTIPAAQLNTSDKSASAPVAATPIPSAGQPFTLTSSTDNLVGTAGDDRFNGVLQDAGATGTTMQPGDVITGGAGTDTVNISVAGDVGGVTGYTISAVQTDGIEKFVLSNFNTDDTADTLIATDLFDGLQTVGLSSSSASGDTQFDGLKNLVTAEMRNGSADLKLVYNSDVVTGTADSQTLTVSNISGGTFTVDGVETLNVKTELVKSTLAAVSANALKTINVTGAVDLTVTGATTATTINGSAFTGKLNVTSGSADQKITGGTGDDTFNLVATLTTADTIDGGTGKDTVTLDAAALTTQFTKVSNIETVAFTAGTAIAAMDVSKLSAGVTTIQMDLSDATDATGLITGTFSNLDGQTVTLKHTVSNAEDANRSDGVVYVITNKVDTTADAVNVTLDAIGATSTAAATNFGIVTLDVANFETVNIQSKKSTTVTANEVRSLTDTLAKTLTITGDADLTVTNTGAALTALNASALDGKLNATLGANKVTVTGGAKDDTIVFASNLNNDDVVDGGLGKDTLTATVTGLTSTTGALRIANVETVTLTTDGNNSLNLAGVTGATSVSVSANTQTITGLDLATKLIATGAALLTVTGANETGADDTLTVEQKLNGSVSNTITTAATLENLSIILNDTGATVNAATFVLTDAVAKKITVTEAADTVTTGTTVALGTLNKSVTTVDTSGVKGTQAFSVANTLTAATLSLSGAAVATVTGTGVNDTINVTSTAAVTHVIDAGAGTADVVNIAVKTGFINVGSITNAETINVTVAAGNSIDLTGDGSASFATSARAVNILGGNSASTFNARTVVTEVTSVNAGTFGGNLLATFGANVLDSTVTVTGGALATDAITASYTTAATYASKSNGVEKLNIDGTGAGTDTFVLDLTANIGVTTINATVGENDTLTISKGVAGQTAVLVSATSTSILEYVLADATGATDVASFELKDAGSNVLAAGASLKTTDIETVNVKISTNAESVSLASIAMTDSTKFASLAVTGDQALTVSALNANVTSINASGMTTGGSFIQSARSQTTAATYTGSVGNDTFRMAHANDVIDGAAGTGDTLVVAANLILGGMLIDLSATADQVTTFNGSANAAIQKGFENIDLSGVTGTGGSDVTAISTGSTITGTANADQINGGAGVDVITGGVGADAMTGGAGNDVFIIVGSAQAVTGNAAIDLIDGGAGTGDELRLSTATTIAGTDILTRITNVEKITSDANAGIVSVTITAASATGTAFTAIDLSGDTDATSNNVISVTGVTTITTITGSAGIDAITIGAAAVANTITGGLGVDVLSLGATLASTVVVGTLDTGATYATADKITGFTTTVDKLSLGVAGATANFATANGAADFAAAVALANTAMDKTVKYYLATAIAANLGGGAGAESLLFIDADMNGDFDDVIALVGIVGVVVAGDIIA